MKRGEIFTDVAAIKRILRKYYKQLLYINFKLQKGQIPGKILLTETNLRRKILNCPRSTKNIDSVVKNNIKDCKISVRRA